MFLREEFGGQCFSKRIERRHHNRHVDIIVVVVATAVMALTVAIAIVMMMDGG